MLVGQLRKYRAVQGNCRLHVLTAKPVAAVNFMQRRTDMGAQRKCVWLRAAKGCECALDCLEDSLAGVGERPIQIEDYVRITRSRHSLAFKSRRAAGRMGSRCLIVVYSGRAK